MRRFLFLVLTLAVSSLHGVEFDSAFSSGMVLQRDLPIQLTGKTEPGREVKVSLDSKSEKVRASDDGSWRVEFPPMKAGGPHRIEATDGSKSATIDDVLIGDVWLCSGQSNMQMGLHETIGGEEAMKESHPDIRILTLPRGGADTPQKTFGAKWEHATPEQLRDFTAVGYYFALALKADPALADVPIGVINSSFGGTAIEAWMPKLPELPEDQISGSMFGIGPSTLFNGMIAPLTLLKLKGVLWYQGEANAGRPQAYVKLLSTMMEQWRTAFGQPDLPFFIVQLPTFAGKMGDLDFSWLREAQATACKQTPNAWFAVTYDTTDGQDLHPKEKQEIGRRLALLAEREVYGKQVTAEGPRPTGVKADGDRVIVTFDQPVKARSGEAKGFAIAGADGDFRFAEATINGQQVSLRAEGIKTPTMVRYAWNGLTDANLVNDTDLPAVPFRTDKLEPQSVTFQPMPTIHRIETPDYQLESSPTGNIASLIIGGKQFLSNEPNGGTSIPVMFGTRNLARVENIGPARIAFSDDRVRVEISSKKDSMTWTVENTGDDSIDFRIALAPAVKIQKQGNAITLTRDEASATVTGVERVGEESTLLAKVAGGKSQTIEWSIRR